MIDFSDKGHLKIRWRPETRGWFYRYIYFTREAPFCDLRVKASVGINDDNGIIRYGLVGDEEWISHISEITGVSAVEVKTFAECAGFLFDEYKRMDEVITKSEIEGMRRSIYSCKLEELSQELLKIQDRFWAQRRSDIAFFGGDDAYKKTDPALVELRHLRLAVLRELKKHKEAMNG